MEKNPARYDVVVIGAGFAGVTAARELATRGFRTLVVEARPEAGGRVRTTTLSNGKVIEIGGTYVHWLQPHLWSEITRYGFVNEVVESGEAPGSVLAPGPGGGLEWTDGDTHAAREKRLFSAFFEGSDKIVPNPFHPGDAADEVAIADGMSIADRLDRMALEEPDRALLEAFFGVHTGVGPEEGSYLTEVRWWAPSGHDHRAMQDSVWTYGLAGGLSRLVEAILADGGSEVWLGEPVTAVTQHAEGVEVRTGSGRSVSARAAVVATPSGVWPHLAFEPPLRPIRTDAAKDGLQAPGGSKGYIVVRGESRAVSVQPRPGHALGALMTSHRRSDVEQVMVFFGTPRLRDATDRVQVEAAVRDFLPHVDVVELVGRNYDLSDPMLRGGWPVMKPGQFGRFLPHETLQAPEGRLVFATADIATGWNGFIDGAIESGLIAARQLLAMLR